LERAKKVTVFVIRVVIRTYHFVFLLPALFASPKLGNTVLARFAPPLVHFLILQATNTKIYAALIDEGPLKGFIVVVYDLETWA